MKAKIAGVLGWLFAMLVLVGAIVASHRWDKDAGLSPVYAILVLAVGSLAFAAPRELLRELLNRASALNFAGFGITLQVTDAVAATAGLPVADEDRDDAGERTLKIIGEDWRKDPAEAVAKLQRRLEKRLRWLEREVYATGTSSNAKTIERLRAGGLIRPSEQRIAVELLEISPAALARDVDGRGERKEAATGFVQRADQVVQQFRLIAFDARVRRELEARGMRIVDIGGQHKKRWPDFYAFDRADSAGAKTPFRIAVRMALAKNGELIEKTRARLRKKWPETPFDQSVQRVIVYPQTSEAAPQVVTDIPAYRYENFLAHIDEYVADR